MFANLIARMFNKAHSTSNHVTITYRWIGSDKVETISATSAGAAWLFADPCIEILDNEGNVI